MSGQSLGLCLEKTPQRLRRNELTLRKGDLFQLQKIFSQQHGLQQWEVVRRNPNNSPPKRDLQHRLVGCRRLLGSTRIANQRFLGDLIVRYVNMS